MHLPEISKYTYAKKPNIYRITRNIFGNITKIFQDTYFAIVLNPRITKFNPKINTNILAIPYKIFMYPHNLL